MLVLSRRAGQKIVFPTLDATLEIVSLKSGTVRLAITAPRELPILREELLASGPHTSPPRSAADLTAALRQMIHRINDRLNGSTIGLGLLRRQLDLGRTEEMRITLNRLEQELAGLRQAAELMPPLNAPLQAARLRRRALLVEDDVNECELLAGFLRLAGIEVETAGDGADALDHLRTHVKPDVVLLDMILPRCDGPTTVRAIRGDPSNANLKIFGVTGSDPDQMGLPEGPAGINRWFRKPLKPEDLLRELDRDS
jgi:carbon storage regulator CsrA